MTKRRDKTRARATRRFKQTGSSNGMAVTDGEMLELLSNLNQQTANNETEQGETVVATKKTNVAVVTLLGSFCPVTISHVDAFVQARQVLLTQQQRPNEEENSSSLEHFNHVLGFFSLNPDDYVNNKFVRSGERMAPLQFKDRWRLVQKAIENFQDWMGVEDWEGCSLEYLRQQFPHLTFVHFCMNGADDVVKHKKWKYASEQDRFITMGRPGKTHELLTKLHAANVNPRHFVVGPELADVSSTQAREILEKYQEASRDDNTKTTEFYSKELDKLLAPQVKEWCISEGPWAPVEK